MGRRIEPPASWRESNLSDPKKFSKAFFKGFFQKGFGVYGGAKGDPGLRVTRLELKV